MNIEPPSDNMLALLKKNKLLNNLYILDLKYLLKLSFHLYFSKGQIVYSEGDTSSSIFFILSGSFLINKNYKIENENKILYNDESENDKNEL